MNNLNPLNQCQDNMLCQNSFCTKTHFRCFSGLCLYGILNNGTCNIVECKLLHLTKKALKQQLDVCPINGIYRFNICNKENCYGQQQNNCQFLHPKWGKKYCYNYFMDDCEDIIHQNHKEWNQIRIEVYTEYKQKLKLKCNPEFNLDEEANYFKQKNICLKNLQGLCEKKSGQCISKHIFWEDLMKIDFIDFKTLKSCIEMNNEENYKSLKNINSQSLLTDNKKLDKIKDIMRFQDVVDVIFIMDFSKSMQKWLDICKSSIKGIIESFQKRISKETLRIGIVGYKGVIGKQKLTYHNLTTNVDELTAFIAKQSAFGDDPGDSDDILGVCTGIEKAMELNISKNPNSILITLLFADTPYYGKQHRNGVSSCIVEHFPEKTIEKLMKRYFNLKRYNFFTCVRITDKTEQMYKVMKENFEGLFISEPSLYQDFGELVKFTLQQSLNTTVFEKEEQYQVKYQKLSKQGESVIEILYNDFDNQNYDFNDTFEVFQFFDVENNQITTVKVPKQILEMQLIPNDMVLQLEEEAEINYKTQIEAQYFSQLFRQRTKAIKGIYPLFFSTPIIYNLKDKKFHGLSKIYGEIQFEINDANWEKYQCETDDNENSDQYNLCLQAFSHFVFEQTQRQYTFIEFQGKKNLFSNPTVLNFIDKDTLQFQKYHRKCNFICEQLKLSINSINATLHLQQIIVQKEDNQIDIFCQNCGTHAIIAILNYLDSDLELCKECKEDQERLENIFCKCCNETFQIPVKQLSASKDSINWCSNCLQKCKIKEGEQCFYCYLQCPQNLKSIEIGETKIMICHKGFKYLTQLTCQGCDTVFDYSTLSDRESYKDGKYWCSKCKQMKFKKQII